MMMMRVSLLFFGVIATPSTGFQFTGDNNKKYTTAFPGLDKLTEKQQGASLHLSLVIEKPDTLSNFALEGLQVELLPQHLADSRSKNNKETNNNNMPCANGSSPQFSSGKRALRLHSHPTFIDKNGLQTAELENGCWELVWREGDICGNLICGFDVPYEVSE